MDSILQVKNLTVDLGDFKLKDMSFTVEKGAVMGLIGRNGAGKTTTLKTIMNILGKESGSITFLGKDNVQDEVFLKNYVGYVAAESYLIDHKTIEYHSRMFETFYDNWDHDIYHNYLKLWGIDEYKRVSDLSTGTKTKVMFLLALAHKPELLILDETTAGLDPVARLELLDEIRKFVSDGNKSVILSTHITSDLDKVADYITLINDGKVIESESMDVIQEKYVVIKGSKEEIIGVRDKFIGLREFDDTFEGLITRELWREELSDLKGITPNIENILTFYIWGVR